MHAKWHHMHGMLHAWQHLPNIRQLIELPGQLCTAQTYVRSNALARCFLPFPVSSATKSQPYFGKINGLAPTPTSTLAQNKTIALVSPHTPATLQRRPLAAVSLRGFMLPKGRAANACMLYLACRLTCS